MMMNMERHNESQKLRIRAKERKKQGQDEKGEAERLQMENPGKPVKLLFQKGKGLKALFLPRYITHTNDFEVILPRFMSISEIRERMEKAFGDM